MSLNIPSQRKRGYEQVKNKEKCRVISSNKMGKIPPMVPPLDHFEGEK